LSEGAEILLLKLKLDSIFVYNKLCLSTASINIAPFDFTILSFELNLHKHHVFLKFCFFLFTFTSAPCPSLFQPLDPQLAKLAMTECEKSSLI
jgi:hypothetical protein